MTGYTPAFCTIYDGTLYGRWPTAAVWASLLPLIDHNGEINKSYEAIAGMTGWPMELLRQGIAELMSPDAGSRSAAEEGRRLVLLDPARPWGWRVVNHAIYRERARLKAKAERERESGENAARMADRRRPPMTADDRRAPPVTPSTDSDSDSDSEKTQEGERALARDPLGLDPQAWQRWITYRREIRKPIKPASLLAAQRKLAGFGTDQAAVVEQSIANGWQGLFALKEAAAVRKSFVPAPSTEQMEREIAAGLRDADGNWLGVRAIA